jgi:hypothetical protein
MTNQPFLDKIKINFTMYAYIDDDDDNMYYISFYPAKQTFQLVFRYGQSIKHDFSGIYKFYKGVLELKTNQPSKSIILNYSLSRVTNKKLKNTLKITFYKDPFGDIESRSTFYIL